MLKVILQRNAEDHVRSLRVVLRDIVRHTRLEFDFLKFTTELISDNLIKQYFHSNEHTPQQINSSCILFSIAGGLADFGSNQTRERYVNTVCDLITVCILMAITPQVKRPICVVVTNHVIHLLNTTGQWLKFNRTQLPGYKAFLSHMILILPSL